MPGTAYKVAYVEVSLLKEEPKPEEKLQVATTFFIPSIYDQIRVMLTMDSAVRPML
jgi:hypothetical protein